MPSELITKLNWVDILMIIAIVRIVYIGARQGFVVEFSKILGLVIALVVAYHYYIGFSNIVVSGSPIPTGFSDLICFSSLLGLIVLAFKFIREGLALIIKAEPIPILHTWGGLLLGALRAWIFISVFAYIFLVSGFGYLEKTTRQSYSVNHIINVSPQIYAYSFDNIISKFFPSEKINNVVFNIISGSQEKQKRPQ